MSTKLSLDIPLNRVEGDLEIKVDLDDNRCTDAWCKGTMFRGFERIMVGRGPLDGLVITPRICGICSTSHLTAAVRALEDLAGITPPAKAVTLRNVALMAEHLQSDVRQSILTFAVDFTNAVYSDLPLFESARRRYSAFEGSSFLDVIKESKKVVEIVALIGGQWPHSSFMVPGGIASLPADTDILQCHLLLERYRRWYELRVLGCTLDRWQEVTSEARLESWLEESEAHRESEVGFLLRYGRSIGLDTIGVGTGTFLSYGTLELPQGTAVKGFGPGPDLIPSGFTDAEGGHEFSQHHVEEHISHSWFSGQEGGTHPSKGETNPYATGSEGRAYSWAKAPRYNDSPAETGPLAEAIVSGQPLFRDLMTKQGPSALLRQLARLLRPVSLMPSMKTWLTEAQIAGKSYLRPEEIETGEGVGLVHASRGALGHWMKLEGGQISHYQIITPTAWNASPRDSNEVRGPVEAALLGTAVRDTDDPVELGHVVRSFDPCLVCTVHALRG